MFVTLLSQAIRFGSVFLYGCTGEILTEKSGHLNLGIPGIMCFGAVGGGIGEIIYMNSVGDLSTMNASMAIFIGILFAMIFAGALGGLYGFLTISLRCNQNVTGLTITTFGVGVMSFWGEKISSTDVTTKFYVVSRLFTETPSYAEGDWFSQIFLCHTPLVYIAFAIAIVAAIILGKTRTGLSLRAIGENPAAADAAGINVNKYKYLSCIIGGAIAGIGGLFYIMDLSRGSLEYIIDALGWLAVALVIFSLWRPALGILGSIVFGALYILPSYVDVSFAQMELVKMVPYLVTIVVLIVTSIIGKKETQPPASLGMSYFREER